MGEIALCLPKDKNMKLVADILREIDFPINGYPPGNRSYRPEMRMEGVRAKIFAEKDIVTQVAIGNYSIGFCGLDWIEEFRIKFPLSGVEIIRELGGTAKRIYACSHIQSNRMSIHNFIDLDKVRIISEYPNLAENFAIENRLKRYQIFRAWGSVEGYLPDHGEIVLIPATDQDDVQSRDLHSLELILDAKLCIIVNRKDYETKDLSLILDYLSKIKAG
jgi:ATP phosphoribosyltransferase